MEKMSKINLFVSENTNCKGRCLLEMQKTLDAQVIAEFLETVRDFYNDDATATKMKNMIMSETNEVIELINKKASDLCSFIDKVFLQRRQQQSSFYRLCHKLARRATPEGSSLPDESKCICFSEENLKAYNVDSAADSKMKLIFDLDGVKEPLEQMCGKLLCTKCKISSTFGGAKYSMSPDCNCTVPTFSSQYKIHEAILDICMNKDSKLCEDSWYLTHLKRDADFYRQKTSSLSMSSDNSVDSFEIIPSDDLHFENDIGTDLAHLSSTKEKFISGQESEFPHVSTENVCSHASTHSIASEAECFNKFQGSPVSSFGITSDNFSKKELSTKNYVGDDNNKSKNSQNYKYIPDTACISSDKPSDIVRKSFSNYLNNNIFKFNDSNCKAGIMVSAVSPDLKNQEICFEKANTNKSHVKYSLKRYLTNEASIHHPLKSHPSDALKNAFSSYFNKENNNKWLIK